jgi:pectate lyase
VAGTIVLTQDLNIRQPYLTIDGFSAPSPGITIAKTGDGTNGETNINTWRQAQTCGHDVLVQGLRFKGVWRRDTDAHSQNASNLAVDGEDFRNCLKNVVIWRNTFINGQDTVGGFWGSVTDSTFAYNFVLYNYHPQQISHYPGGVDGQERQRLSIHHNIYAYAHDRIPNVRGNVWDTNLYQNVFHKWAAYGFGGGYATRFRCRGGGCPRRINLISNHYTSGGTLLDHAVDFIDGAAPSQVYMSETTVPSAEREGGSAAQPFANDDGVTLFPALEFVNDKFQFIGHLYPTAEEARVMEEVKTQVLTEL